MAKAKNKKKSSSEKVNNLKSIKKKKTLNPFEVHINKEKMKVLGKKERNDKGMPGIARSKALQKRKHTLLPEYNVQHKSNTFLDKRIGERDKFLTDEDKATARFAAVRAKQHKKSIYNLADDEVLTHRGQTLSEIEKFEDIRSDDDDDDNEDGRPKGGQLGSQYVDDIHFGGGILKKADQPRSHKELIEQIIAESKKRKAEQQKQKEATEVLTEKLDNEWKDLLPLVNKSKASYYDAEEKTAADEFDKVMGQLRFEARGKPSDRLKSEDELAKEEKERLEKLEQERLNRMRGNITQEIVTKHKSADDLDDNFEFENIEEEITLAYDEEGQSNYPVSNGTKENGNDEAKSDSEDDNEDGEEEEVETESEDNLSDLKESDESSDDEIPEEQEIEDNNSETQDSEDKNSETQNSEDETLESHSTKDETPKTLNIKKDNKPSTPNKINNDIKENLLLRKELMEKARKELPYTFALPTDYELLQETLKNQSPESQNIIIERMIKCNHPSLKKGNKESLAMLFAYLLQHINDVAADVTDDASITQCFNTFSFLVPQLYDLAHLNPENAHDSILEVIKEKQGDLGTSKTYPDIDVLLFIKLISCLFSTSDFKHKVVSPTFVFIDRMLSKCKVKNRRDVAYGLFLVSLIAEFTHLSKRFLPSAINFLNGILHMAVPKRLVSCIKVLPPFRTKCTDLVLNTTATLDSDLKLSVTDLLPDRMYDEEFKLKATYTAICLLNNFFDYFKIVPTCISIFETSVTYLNLLSPEEYGAIGVKITKFIERYEEYKTNARFDYIVLQKKRPKALRLYEPNIEQITVFKKHKVQSAEKAERQKLIHKVKQERKGALREIRRDNAFLSNVKLKETLKSDTERKEKVKRIYAEANIQQSELNAMERKNKSKKRKR